MAVEKPFRSRSTPLTTPEYNVSPRLEPVSVWDEEPGSDDGIPETDPEVAVGGQTSRQTSQTHGEHGEHSNLWDDLSNMDSQSIAMLPGTDVCCCPTIDTPSFHY